jgi:hypothetical protein
MLQPKHGVLSPLHTICTSLAILSFLAILFVCLASLSCRYVLPVEGKSKINVTLRQKMEAIAMQIFAEKR